MIAERLACGSLCVPGMKTNGAHLRLMPTNDDHSERPTDPANEPPSARGHDLMLPQNAAVPNPQPDPNNYSHFVLGQLLTRVRGLEADRGSVDIPALLDKQADRIGADVGLIRSSISGLQQSVDALVTRVGNTERAVVANQDATSEQFAQIEMDMAVMRTQLDRLDRELAILKAVKDATAPGSAT